MGERNTVPQNIVCPTNFQDLVRAIVQSVEEIRQLQSHPTARVLQQNPHASPASSDGASGASSAFQNWNQIKFVARLFPAFSGKEEESVVKWLERVWSVVRLHNVSDKSLVLAAVNQLQDRALA